MAHHNWEDIKKEYVEGIVVDGKLTYPSQGDLSVKFGIDAATIGRRASKEKWSVQREILISKISAKRQEKTVEMLSKEGSKFDLDCFNLAQDALDKAKKFLDGCTAPDDFNKLATAMKNIQAIGKASLGDVGKDGSDLTINVNIIEE
jgi:hypothetical protein